MNKFLTHLGIITVIILASLSDKIGSTDRWTDLTTPNRLFSLLLSVGVGLQLYYIQSPKAVDNAVSEGTTEEKDLEVS